MNGKDILLGLKYVGDDLVELAEYGQFPASSEKREKVHRKIHRPFLLAAMIALLLLLVGCAVVYTLSLNGLRLGDQVVTQDVFDYDPDSGEAIAHVGQETQTQQVLTLAGLGGTPASKAAKEWYEFCKSYDPDRAIQKAAWGNKPDFSEEYYGYGLYSQEMKEKLDEILTKYGLKLRGRQVKFKTSKLLFQSLGMENVLKPNSEVRMETSYASYYENGNLDLSFRITVPVENSSDFVKTNAYLYYRPKNCFIPDTAVLTEGEWEEWNYSTASGDKVLIIRSENSGSAWIFCDRVNFTASLRLDTIQQMYEEKEDGVPVARFTLMTKHQLEQVAEAIDFSLEPKLVDGWENLPDDAVPAGQEINGYRIDPVSAFTDGYGYQIVLRITAPEGVALTDPDDHYVSINPGDGVAGSCREDGDGKLNTCLYILSDYSSKYDYPKDGSLPYPEGYMIPVYWEDLYYSYYDFEKKETVKTLLAAGAWRFDIPLSNADTREIELLSQPITAKACTGWKIDGTDVYEDLEITSIKLRSLGIDLTCENDSADFFCFTGQFSYIVMKDGTKLETYWRVLAQPIDLDQVAYVQLADKTIIPMPGVDEKTVNCISEMIQAEQDGMPIFEDGVELLTEPITMKSLAGYETDSTGSMTPLYEYIPVSSVMVHPAGLVIMGPAAFDSPDNQATVIMNDGSQILLTGKGGSPYGKKPMNQLVAESNIDLSKVDHVILPDGTKIPMPAT